MAAGRGRDDRAGWKTYRAAVHWSERRNLKYVGTLERGENNMRRSWLLVGAVVLAGAGWANRTRADVRLPAIISNNMVLQADMDLPIWGWAAPGEEVSVALGEAKASAKADEKGNWSVKLPAQKTSANPVEMTVTGKNTIKVSNILVGEVWGGSGQSNMQWSVSASSNRDQEIQSANHPQIRLFLVPMRLSPKPIDDLAAQWVVCTSQTVPNFSAVLYFFGREIHKTLNVPVGLIGVSWGGSRIEPWIDFARAADQPELKADVETYTKLWDERIAKRRESLPQFKAWLQAAEAVPAGQDIPDPPALPPDPLSQFTSPAAMYNGMVQGLIPYALRGFLWYQGESNVGQGLHYADLMKGLINNWRRLWREPDFPFLYVQLAPFSGANYGTGTALPEIWEAQTATLAVPNTGMAVTTDIATVNDIHPPNKQDVGKRLSLWALANTYGKKDLVYSGPLYDSMAVEGDKIRLKFKHTSPGLVSRDGKPLTWFSIAGDDKQFYPADAIIEGDTVVVKSPNVPKPAAVRFGWNKIAEPNLSNKAGLPASPFRTDQWADAKNAPAQ
jgi:sialate O-acetylesterase